MCVCVCEVYFLKIIYNPPSTPGILKPCLEANQSKFNPTTDSHASCLRVTAVIILFPGPSRGLASSQQAQKNV